MLINIVSSEDYLDFFPKFEENKDFSKISTKIEILKNFEEKNQQNSRKLSFFEISDKNFDFFEILLWLR